MGRPLKSSDAKTGKERIKDAFWQIYLAKPIDRITVREVCEKAALNKTSFYYHYDCLEDVLHAIEDEVMPTEIPEVMVEGYQSRLDSLLLISQFIGDEARLDMICRLLSSNGDPTFVRRMKDAMKENWCRALKLEYESLSSKDKLLIEMVMGGSTSVLANKGDGMVVDLDDYAQIVSEVIAPLIQCVLDETDADSSRLAIS